MYTKLSPNHSGKRTHPITRITPHCFVGQVTAQAGADYFSRITTASANYVIGKDGQTALVVEEANRSWCSSSKDNDQRAITIECASDTTHPYAMNDKVFESLINLCTDICRRYNKTVLLWIEDKASALSYTPASNEMQLTVHRWFKNKACPGDWLYSRFPELARRVTENLNPKIIYRVQTGAFGKRSNAEKALKELRTHFPDAIMKYDNPWYKIQVGAYSKYSNAESMANQLKTKGFNAYITQ